MKINKRITFGRRRSDWLIPLGFIAVGIVGAFWASYNRTVKADTERQNQALRQQVQLMERLDKNFEKTKRQNEKLQAQVKVLQRQLDKYEAKAGKRMNSSQANGAANLSAGKIKTPR